MARNSLKTSSKSLSLVHPVSPMNNGLRGKLAAVVAGRLGIGGSEWDSAIEEHREFLREKFASDPSILAKKFSFSPYQWVLEYKARLRQGVLFGNPIVHQSRQRGNLLHRFSELVFAPDSPIQWRRASSQQVRQSLEAEWKKLLLKEGATIAL